MARGEDIGVIVDQHRRFCNSLASTDQYVLNLGIGVRAKVPKGQGMFLNELAGLGLSGRVLFFSAARQYPIGLPVMVDSEEQPSTYATGIYLPTAPDKDRASSAEDLQALIDGRITDMYAREKSHKRKHAMGDGLIVATKEKLRFWSEQGMFPKVDTDHSTTATNEDERWVTEASWRLLERYVPALIDAVGEVASHKMVPGELNSTTNPINSVGGRTTILASAFISTGHDGVAEKVYERDKNRCSMPRMGSYLSGGPLEFPGGPPTCDRNLENYYPRLRSQTKRIVLGKIGDAEINHILPRGAAIAGGTNLGFLLSETELKHPARLLLLLSGLNLSQLTALDVGLDKMSKEDMLKQAGKIILYVDAAINNALNLTTADRDHHHLWYHPDELLAKAIASFIYGVNSRQIPVPTFGTKEFEDFKAEYIKKILCNEKTSTFDGDYAATFNLVKEGRMLVGLRGQPYWQTELTKPQLITARVRTKEFFAQKVSEGEAEVLSRVGELANGYGADLDQLSNLQKLADSYFAVQELVLNSLRTTRSLDKMRKLFALYGIQDPTLE